MSIRQVHCSFDQNQVLTPVGIPGPDTTIALIDINDDSLMGKTGTISYAGNVRAFITFDQVGARVESYTLTMQDFATQASIENIIRVL